MLLELLPAVGPTSAPMILKRDLLLNYDTQERPAADAQVEFEGLDQGKRALQKSPVKFSKASLNAPFTLHSLCRQIVL